MSAIITGLLEAPPFVLPLAIVLPTIVIILSFRLNFQVQASFLLYIFLIGSFLTSVTGVVCLYRHFTAIPETLDTLLGQTQDFARTILSTTSTSIFLVKFLTKAQASRETVNNVGIGFFILMIFSKFCSVTILLDVKFYSFQSTEQSLSYEMLEVFEFMVDIICTISTLLFIMITCNQADNLVILHHAVSNDDSLPVRSPLNLPTFPVMAITRVFLLFSLEYQIMFATDKTMRTVVEDMFVVLQALIIPLLFLLTNSNMRLQLVGIFKRNQESSVGPSDEQQLDVFHGSQDRDSPRVGERRVSSAPTRPSSALMPALPGGVNTPTEGDRSVRIQYRSNIR